jgi:hypothetical protein
MYGYCDPIWGGGLERGLGACAQAKMQGGQGIGLHGKRASRGLEPGKAAPRGRGLHARLAYARASPARWWLACTPCMMPEHLPRL